MRIMLLGLVAAGTAVIAMASSSLRLPDFDGRRFVSPTDFAGHTLLYTFWDRDCPPCREDIAGLPTLRKAQPELAIVVVSVSDRQATRRLARTLAPLNIPLLIIPGNARALLRELGNAQGTLPYHVLFTSDGKACGNWQGPLGNGPSALLLHACGSTR